MLLDKIHFACNEITSNSLEFLSDFINGILISMNYPTARKSKKMCVFGFLRQKKQKPMANMDIL